MRIPHSNLPTAVLQKVVEEFVTRDGTDHSNVKQRVVDVIAQIESGSAELHFDSATATCNIVPVSA